MPNANAAFALAKELYAEWGVDVDAALAALDTMPVSLHCWQLDDVAGFENAGGSLDGGLAATGNYPGKARTPVELRADYDAALKLIPGPCRANLHAIYLETDGKKVDRDAIAPDHFTAWLEWAKSRKIGLDFNPTCFSHPKAADGFTLSSADKSTRDFWIAHAKASRRIAAFFGKTLDNPCVNNVWVPDGMKDVPADRSAPRARLKDSLDQVFAEKFPESQLLDAVECKLFGIGSESYVVGSHEFYLEYSRGAGVMPTFDLGHFHPTETVADKISSVLLFQPRLLLHLSRGVRWDSDHVALFGDELTGLAREAVAPEARGKLYFALDYFDASINRVAALACGARNWRKALLYALLEPAAKLRKAEAEGDFTARMAWMEEAKSLPWGLVWNQYCAMKNVPGANWLDEAKRYEAATLPTRK